jgi:co-chaperonin GroES (HSP10)
MNKYWVPLNETYFVRPEPLEVSNLVLEQYQKDHVELMNGVVTHVGTGTLLNSGFRVPLQAKVGDRVKFGSKVGHKVTIDGEELLLLAEANVLAVEKQATRGAYAPLADAEPPSPPPDRTIKKGGA